MGLFYEQFQIGKTIQTRRRTLTEADIVAFCGLSGDFNLVHTDALFAAEQTPFGSRIAHGPLGLSVAIGLLSQLNLIEDTALALLHVHWDFKGAILAGDTIHVRALPTEKRETRHPRRGIVTITMEVINQRDETVQEGGIILMIRRQPASEP